MRRLQLGLAMVALPVCALSLFIAGCGKDEKKTDSSSEVKKDEKEKPKGETKVLEPKGGVLKGKITLKGKPDTDADTKKITDGIAALKDQSQKDYCMKGDEAEKTGQAYRIGGNNQLGNVFVWIVPDTGTSFKVTQEQLEEAKKNPVKFRQPHCAFKPHCAILFAEYRSDPTKTKKEKTGQILEIVNDAEISHNTKWTGGARNPGGNETLAPGKDRKVDNLKAEATPVTLQCNIHGWMDAYLRVVDTPYYAISHSDTLDGKDQVATGDAKFGTYEIKNLPVGKVRVLAWHERAHWLNKNEGKGEVIEIKEGAPTEKDFEAEAK